MKNYQLIIDDNTWKDFKAVCAYKDKSMAVVLRELIKKYIDDAWTELDHWKKLNKK